MFQTSSLLGHLEIYFSKCLIEWIIKINHWRFDPLEDVVNNENMWERRQQDTIGLNWEFLVHMVQCNLDRLGSNF
jgi:hypothetical protein